MLTRRILLPFAKGLLHLPFNALGDLRGKIGTEK